jgi:hypothetical protein
MKSSIIWDVTPYNPLKAKQKTSMKHTASRALLAACFMLVSFSAFPSTLKMEATCFSETSVGFQRATWSYNPEDRILHNHRCENLKSYMD